MLPVTFMDQVVIVSPPVAPPAPPWVVGSPPSPPAPPMRSSGARSLYPVSVELRAGTALLWSGTVEVGGTGSTSLSHRLSEPAPSCGDALPGRRYAETSYSLSLYPHLDGAGTVRLQVNASWTRTDPGSCDLPSGSRTVSFTQEVELVHGRPSILRGDGGLTVTLKRE